MSGKRELTTQAYLLLVEGHDDFWVSRRLAEHIGIDVQNKVFIKICEGKSKIAPELKLLTTRDGFANVKAVGIIRDADDDLFSEFQSGCSALRNAGLKVPRSRNAFAAGPPRTGVFVFPNNQEPGRLDDLCLRAVRIGQLRTLAVDYVDNAIALKPNSNFQKHKMVLHAYLAGLENCGLRVGEAATAGLFDWNADAFAPFTKFLKNLCS